MAETAAFHAIVRGRVQGVYFRAFVQRHAVRLGLRGYARNLRDRASVEVHAEGERPQLERLLEALRQGPPGARVDTVSVTWPKPTGECKGFEVVE